VKGKGLHMLFPLFSARDNSVHLHPCGWVFPLYLKGKLPCLLFDVDIHTLIDKAMYIYIYVKGKYNIMLAETYTIVLDI